MKETKTLLKDPADMLAQSESQDDDLGDHDMDEEIYKDEKK